MGVAISQNIITKKYSWYEAPVVGTKESLKASWLIIASLGKTVYDLAFHAEVPKGVAGPVGIAQLTGQFVEIGPLAVLSFMAILSLNLAILNILPIPALDGGRLFFILIEAVSGRKISQKFESKAHAIGMAILLSLVAIITINDIIRFFSGQPIIPKP
jgi:regulator of sigma E protease